MNNKKTLKKLNTSSILLLMLLMLFVSIPTACFLGSVDFDFRTVIKVLYAKIFGQSSFNLPNEALYIIWELRLPRAILAFAIGGGLAVAGACMQAVTQNVLAEPYILGVSSGALAMVTMVYFFDIKLFQTPMGISIMAFIGAVISLIFVYHVGGVGHGKSNARLILAGMSVSIILGALSNFFIVTMPSVNRIKGIMCWMMGSLAGARWNNIAIPCIGIIIASVYFLYHSRDFDTLSLGNDTALSLGVDVVRLRKRSIIVVSFISGLAVAAGGLIGLVGFIIPHIVRLLVGAEHRKLFPLSFLLGALFLIWMDVIARTVLAPEEIPIGIFTALCGGPFFLSLLLKKGK